MLASTALPSTPPHPNDRMDSYRVSSAQPSPSLSDDSVLELPEFPYFTNSQGEFVRMKTPSPEHSPSPSTSSRRASLSRSESAPVVVESGSPIPASTTTARQFTRVQSGPASSIATPATTSTYFPRSSGLSSTARKLTNVARRVVRMDDRDADQGKENGDAMPLASSSTNTRPLADLVPMPQRTVGPNGRQMLPVPNRVYTNRLLKKVETIAEVDDIDWNGENRPRSSLSNSTGIRPRRSASLSDTAPEDLPAAYFRNGVNIGARRVTLEEKLKREREIALEEGYARALAEREQEQLRRAGMEGQMLETRQSPSPTHIALQRVHQGHHQRAESDTVQTMGTASSPTVVERRVSPANVGSDSNSSGEHGRAFPPQAANGDRMAAGPTARQRRSPSAEQQGHDVGTNPSMQNDKMWAYENGPGQGAEDSKPDHQYQKQRNTKAAMQQQQMLQNPPVPSRKAPSMPSQHQQSMFGNGKPMVIGKKTYTRLDLIGRGGTSRVYRVVSPTNEILAVKRVQLDETDPETVNGYLNEIKLLKRLDGNERIIRLLDSDTKPGSGGKGILFLLMELGEIDMARLLQEQQKRPVDFVWIAYYFKQMLEAVQIIHEEKIVHSDLKPANFVLVKGQLKLIDFGIANAIANDTTNIHRDHQVGTVNYMSPETIENPDGVSRRLKVGRPSDVWSLGCILYQMIYGHPPFHHLSGIVQKMKAIPDNNAPINFPASVVSAAPFDPSLPQDVTPDGRVCVPEAIINTMKRCLVRSPKDRATIPELLADNWLTMRDFSATTTPPLSSSLSPTTPSPPPPPTIESLLKDDEAVISPPFVAQLIQFARGLSAEQVQESDMELLSRHVINQLRGIQQ